MMGSMDGGTRLGGPEPTAVRLHLNRAIGWGLYGTLTAATFVIGMLGTATNLRSGRLWIAGLIAIAALAVSGFLAVVTHALVWPELIATAVGIAGRMPRGGTIEAGWSEVTIDVDTDAGPGTLRLDIHAESVSVSAQTWIGFDGFVRLLGNTPQAAARLTPAALREVTRLLQLGR